MTQFVGLARCRRSTACRGFGLLEAIVAMALLAGTGLALFAWINQNLQAASRLRLHAQQAQLLMSAQTLIGTVNPLQSPQGRLDVGGVAVQWASEPLAPVLANATVEPGVEGPWRVGLFRLNVRAQDLVSGVELGFEQWQAGALRTLGSREVPP